MSLFIASLNSGSNGNCYYIGTETEAVLIDAGISCRETEKRMKILGLSMNAVKAIFISHEHSDHIKGLQVLAEKYNLQVYITADTGKYFPVRLKRLLFRPFIAYEPIIIGSLSVIAFPKHHDAADPHSFIIKGRDTTIGVFTDIGTGCERVRSFFSQCHAAFLETNYDEHLLENGRYPVHLKKRISGGLGHLSNRQALEIFREHRPAFMSHLLLSHLSRENNSPEIVKQLFAEHAMDTKIIIAGRYEHTAVYNIFPSPVTVSLPVRVSLIRSRQLNLFE